MGSSMNTTIKSKVTPFVTAWAYDDTTGCRRIIRVPVILEKIPELPELIQVSGKYYVLSKTRPVSYLRRPVTEAFEESENGS